MKVQGLPRSSLSLHIMACQTRRAWAKASASLGKRVIIRWPIGILTVLGQVRRASRMFISPAPDSLAPMRITQCRSAAGSQSLGVVATNHH